MTGAEILTGVVSAVVLAILGWVGNQVASFLGIKKDGALMTMVDEYMEKAVDKYDDKLKELIKDGGQNVAKHNELVGHVVTWVNDNAPKIMKQFFGKNSNQLENYVSNFVMKKVKQLTK